MDEGYIKFNCEWIKGPAVDISILKEINNWRNKLYQLGLIGAYPDGIGFGNISIREKELNFIISGSTTGNINTLNENHYTRVSDYDLDRNTLTCIGPIIASSESLSHAAIYECSPHTNAVIHIHHAAIWEKNIHQAPTTLPDAAYGTPEMANEIKRLFQKTDVEEKKIIIMSGHPEGIFSFGKTMDEAGSMLLELF